VLFSVKFSQRNERERQELLLEPHGKAFRRALAETQTTFHKIPFSSEPIRGISIREANRGFAKGTAFSEGSFDNTMLNGA
jgi:hypothetical protein